VKSLKNFILAAILIAVFSVAAFAGDKSHATVTLNHPAQLGSTALVAGEYDLSWTGTGNDVKVTLSRGKKVHVTVPARVVEQRDPEGGDGSVSYAQTEAGLVKLTGIQLSKVAFTFTDGAAGSENGQ
jgi:hypothetical protein